MALTSSGQVRYILKTPYGDGTTHIVLDPLNLMARGRKRVFGVQIEACARCVASFRWSPASRRRR